LGLESIYKLSVMLNLIDNITNPMRNVTGNINSSLSSLEKAEASFGGMIQGGTGMLIAGKEIAEAVLSPIEATFDTQRAIGQLKAMGVEDLETLSNAATDFSNTWAGTTKAEFLAAAVDIKGGIDNLNEEGIAAYTEIAGITAKATDSTIGEMTDLFATGYGIYKDFYSDISEIELAEIFSAGIAESILVYKASGSSMAQALTSLGASATAQQVPLEEQLAILGQLQATMSGSEAGTKYSAFLKTAGKAGETLGLSFLDANNNLKSVPEILDLMRNKYGETLDAIEKREIQEAFGTVQAVDMIDLLYTKTDSLQDNILHLYSSMGEGVGVTARMASEINNMEPDQYELLQQKLQILKETVGSTMLPLFVETVNKMSGVVDKAVDWVNKNEALVRILMTVFIAVSMVLIVVGGISIAIGVFGTAVTRIIGVGRGFVNILKLGKSMLETLRIYGMYAGDALKLAFLKIKAGGGAAIAGLKQVTISIFNFAKTAVVNGAIAIKNFIISMAAMAKQAIITAVTAMPGLIASVWAFTVALLANPITWIILGIVALIAAIVLLWKNWDTVVAFLKGAWDSFVNGLINAINWVKEKFAGLPAPIKLLIVALNPFVGIPLLIATNWNTLVTVFKNLWTNISTTFTTGINNIKNFFSSLPEWFRESGKKIVSTLAQGIESAFMKPYEAVKNGFAKIRQLLPFSDAKEGPLSTLTLSGKRVLETITTGIHQGEDLPAQAVEKSFKQVDFKTTKKANLKVNLQNEDNVSKSTSSGNSVEEKNVVIKQLTLNIDFSKIKDLKALLKLVKEIENYNNANASATGEGELVII